jgi:hypothetical protein
MKFVNFTRMRLATLFAFSTVFVASVLLRAAIPNNEIFSSPHDDGLMVQMANQISHSGWIGPWSSLTNRSLVKGIGFPIYLAITKNLFPWSPLVTTQILLLAAAALAIREFIKLGLKKKLGLAFFTLVAFLPVWFGSDASRIYRDGFLAAITFLALAISLILRRQISELVLNGTTIRQLGKLLLASVSLGALFTIYYITKVNWQPIAISVAFIIFCSVITTMQGKRKFLSIASILTLVLAASVSALAINGVALKNEQVFGVKLVEDLSSGTFPMALNKMMSVSDQNRPEYIDVSQPMMNELYTASPTLKKLEPFLGPDSMWSKFECQNFQICDQGPGLWLPFALRDAAEQAGLTSDAVAFQNTFRSIADEITNACEIRMLNCSSEGLAPGLRSLSSQNIRLLIDSFGDGLNQIMSLSSAVQNYSNQPPDNLAIWKDTVNGSSWFPSMTSKYNPNGNALGGFFRGLVSFYKAFWIQILFLSFVGLFLGFSRRRLSGFSNRNTLNFQLIGLSSLMGLVAFLIQLALLEADSGMMLMVNGPLYLLPSYPLVLLTIMSGYSVIQDWAISKFTKK